MKTSSSNKILYPFRLLAKIVSPLLKSNTFIQLIILSAIFLCSFKILQWTLEPNENILFKQMTSYAYEEPKDQQDDANNEKANKGLYLIGVIFFSGFLVMVLTNGVRNSIDKANSGDARYAFKDHILIYGYNGTVSGIITNAQNRYENKITIVVVVKENVAGVRESLQGLFGKINDLYVMHSSMISEDNLMEFYPEKAREIFIVGNEDDNTDYQNLACYHTLSHINNFENWPVRYVYLYLWEPSSLTMLRNRRYGRGVDFSFPKKAEKKLKIINPDEIWARRVIVDSANRWPHRNISMRDGIRITYDSDYFTHVVIYGLNNVSEILATTIAKACHHPNYVTKGIRTKITIIDKECREKIGILFGKYYDYMDLCHYTLQEFKFGEATTIRTHIPRGGYDIIDTEWEFIESDYNDIHLHDVLEDYCTKEKSLLTIFICEENSKMAIKHALDLPKSMFDKQIPVWVYSRYGYNINEFMDATRYSNVDTWGMVDEVIVKEEWEEEYAKYLNYFYLTANYEPFAMLPAFRDGSIFNSEHYINVKESWGILFSGYKQSNIDTMTAIPSMMSSVKAWSHDSKDILMSREEEEIFSQLEHTRWCSCKLIDGYRVVSEEMRMEAGTAGPNNSHWQNLRKDFYHPYICAYNQLPLSMHEIDSATIEFYRIIFKTLS